MKRYQIRLKKEILGTGLSMNSSLRKKSKTKQAISQKRDLENGIFRKQTKREKKILQTNQHKKRRRKKKRKKLKRWIDYLRRQKDDPKKKKSRGKKPDLGKMGRKRKPRGRWEVV